MRIEPEVVLGLQGFRSSASMATRSKHTLEQILEICEKFYQQNGFVKWIDVANVLGVSRQAVQLRLSDAVSKGLIDKGTIERYQSMTSRAAAARENRQKSREADKLRISILLTPENKLWLNTEAVLKQAHTSDLINGLINKAREGA